MTRAVKAQIHRLVEQLDATVRLDSVSTGDLALEISRRLEPNAQIKINNRFVRVTHTHFIDKLAKVSDINKAIAKNMI